MDFDKFLSDWADKSQRDQVAAIAEGKKNAPPNKEPFDGKAFLEIYGTHDPVTGADRTLDLLSYEYSYYVVYRKVMTLRELAEELERAEWIELP